MGVSTSVMPFAASSAASRMVDSGTAVEQSAITKPDFAPSSKAATASST